MNSTGKQTNGKGRQYALNLTLAAVAGQVGCLTLVIVLSVLFLGLWLDSRMQTKPLFTVALLVLSVPVTVAVMFWVVRAATAKLQTPAKKTTDNVVEEDNSGTDS